MLGVKLDAVLGTFAVLDVLASIVREGCVELFILLVFCSSQPCLRTILP